MIENGKARRECLTKIGDHKMNLPVKLVLLASASIIATSALAGGVDRVLTNTIPQNYVYVGGDLGYASLSTPDKNIVELPYDGVSNVSHSTGNLAGGANIGIKHAFTPNVLAGAELGWDYNGYSKYTITFPGVGTDTSKVYSSDLNFLATGTYLLNNGINLFGKAGLASVKQTLSNETPDGYKKDDVTHTTKVLPMIAVGAGYQVKLLNFYLQYDHIFGKDAGDFNDLVGVNDNGDAYFKNVVNVDAIKAGVSVNFAI